MLEKLIDNWDDFDSIIRKGIEKRLYSGACYGIFHCNKPLAEGYAGWIDPEHTNSINEFTLWDCASITKPVVTSTGIMILVDSKIISLNQTLADYFPGEAPDHLKDITVRHLLAHTSGLPAWADLYTETGSIKDAIRKLMLIKPKHAPGSVREYSCLGYIFLGLIIEKASGLNLSDFASEYIFQPSRMTNSGFNPGNIKNIAHTEDPHFRKRRLVGEVHDTNCWRLGGVAGNAGLFSTLRDLVKFINATEKGLFLSDKSRELLLSRREPGHPDRTLGWFIAPSDMLPIGKEWGKSAIGHTGFTGVSIIYERSPNIIVIILTNRTVFSKELDQFRALRNIFYKKAACILRVSKISGKIVNNLGT